MAIPARTWGAACASIAINGAAIGLALHGWSEAPPPPAPEEIVISTMLVRVRGSDLPALPPAAAVVPSTPPRDPPPPPPPEVVPIVKAEAPPTPPAAETTTLDQAAAPAAQAAAPAPATAPLRTGDRDGLNVNAPHGQRDDYASRLRVWLEAHKIYPKRARLRREEGVVLVHFIVDRQGRLLGGDIARSSGYASLDAEALAMLDRSNPFPAAPHHVRGERIEISAPVAFALNR